MNIMLLNCFIYIEKSLKVFLDTLLELNEVDMDFSDDEIRDEVLNMMFAVCWFLCIIET